MPALKIGQIIGGWTVIETFTMATALVQCECGSIRKAKRSYLESGNHKCLRCSNNAKITIGVKVGRHKPTINVWSGMIQRCTNPNTKYFAIYGGRGICVCERWLDYDNFYLDMGPKPHGLSLDRIDVNGDYEPTNCRWATDFEQNNNKRNNVRVMVDGVSKTVTEAAREKGLDPNTVFERIKRGLPIEKWFLKAGQWKNQYAKKLNNPYLCTK